MTTGLITPTEGQEFQLDRFVGDAIRRARRIVFFDKSASQRLIGNGGKFQDDMVDLIVKYSAADEMFEVVTSFEFTVPRNYTWEPRYVRRIFSFTVEEMEKYKYFGEETVKKDFSEATKNLIPGKTYGAKIFRVKGDKTIKPDDVLKFLETQSAITIGSRGHALIRQLKKRKFPGGMVCSYIGDGAWRDDHGGFHIQQQHRYTDDGGSSGISYGSEANWENTVYFLCVFELNA